MSGSRLRLQWLGRWRRVGAAAALTTAVVLVAVAPDGTGRRLDPSRADHHDQRLDLGRPARGHARPEVRAEPQRAVQALTGRLRCRHLGRRARPGVDRHLVARPEARDPGGLVFRKIAKDALCVVTNNANHLPNLSQNGVQAIFGGDVRRWNDVPGATRGNNVIDVFVRTAASGTQDAFEKIFMDPEHVNNSIAKQKASNGLIQQAVKDDKERDRLRVAVLRRRRHPVAYKGVTCNLRNAKSGQYGGLRNFCMVTRGNAARAVDVHQVDSRTAPRRSDHRHELGSAALSG